MSKMSELALQLAELKRCGEILIGISESLSELFSSAPGERVAKAQADIAEPAEPEKSKEAKEDGKQKPESKEITIEDVRAVLIAKARGGHTAEIQALLKKHGGAKLPEIDKAEYPALLAEVEAL